MKTPLPLLFIQPTKVDFPSAIPADHNVCDRIDYSDDYFSRLNKPRLLDQPTHQQVQIQDTQGYHPRVLNS